MSYPHKTKELYQPSTDELCKVLKDGLTKFFKNVSVNDENCPDLTQMPWTLAAPGICGHPKLIDCGGVCNLTPLADKTKIYDFDKLAKLVGDENSFFTGAGAAGFHILGTNAEMVANVRVGVNENIQTRIAKMITENEYLVEKINFKEFGILGNFLATEGNQGKVIKISVKERIGEENFTNSIRAILKEKYPDQMIGLGGVFIVKTGKAKFHIMPDFSSTPLNTTKDVDDWLKFFEMNAPLICFSVIYNIDQGYDLRVEHTHGFNHKGQGGHYHYDTSPKDVEYEGFFVVGETLFRVDPPQAS